MNCIKSKKELRELGFVEVTFTELKRNIKKIISKARTKQELELIFENLYLSFKQRRKGDQE